MTAPIEPQPDQAGLTVLYDGACPVCSREIAWYRRQATTERVNWVDLSRCQADALPAGIQREQALQRFHVIQVDGQQVAGAAAFARLWACYPPLRPFARLARLPGIAQTLEVGYLGFLRLRTLLGRLLPAPKPEGERP